MGIRALEFGVFSSHLRLEAGDADARTDHRWCRFIDANLAVRALAENVGVRVTDNVVKGNIVGLGVTLVKASILDTDALRDALAGVDPMRSVGWSRSGPPPRRVAKHSEQHQQLNGESCSQRDRHASGVGAGTSGAVGYATVASSSSIYGTNPANQWVRFCDELDIDLPDAIDDDWIAVNGSTAPLVDGTYKPDVAAAAADSVVGNLLAMHGSLVLHIRGRMDPPDTVSRR